MAALSSVVNHSAYFIAVICLVVLCAWSIVYTWTKKKDDADFTELHMTLSALSGTCIVLLVLSWIHKSAK